MNITELDKKILYQLDQDGRMPLSEIAKNISTSTQVVKYHFEQLKEKGVIKHFWAFTDYDKMDYSFFWGYWLKFVGLTKEREKEMYEDFNSNKFVPIIQRADGYADVFICIISKDIFHHNEILQKIFNKYGENIASSDIFVGLGFIKFPRTYLINKENEFQKFTISGGTKEKIKLTEIDRKIVSLLLVDGRMEFKKMADILNVSPALIHKQYGKLTKAGVITKITYSIDHKKLGVLFYRICIKIVQFNQTRVDDLYKFCCLHPNIINYIKGMGSWELLLEIEIESRDALRELVRELKNQFKDIIREIEINEIYKTDKFTQMAIEYPELINKTQV